MKTIPFITSVLERHYLDQDEERKRNITILVILDFLLVTVMIAWTIGFWFLQMPEMFWLTGSLLILFIVALLSLIYHWMSFEKARFLSLFAGLLITAVPPIYYGIDTIVTVHLAFEALATILLFSRKERKVFLNYLIGIFLSYVVVVVYYFFYGPLFVVPEATFRIFNIIVALDTMFIALYFTYFFFSENTGFKDLLATEREKSDQLLLSIFPETIASKLRNSNQSVADSFDHVTILFADIVGFTQYSSEMSPNELVEMLDDVFSEFDALVDKYKIEKIKTIGDAYMAVGGLPTPDPRHCHNVVALAVEITGTLEEKFSKKYNIKMRIGIHTGKAVAGVIGNKKFSYDLWGDSVNIASRFEASGQPGRIHISEEVKNLLGDAYRYEECGEIMIKGKGMMRSFFIES